MVNPGPLIGPASGLRTLMADLRRNCDAWAADRLGSTSASAVLPLGSAVLCLDARGLPVSCASDLCDEEMAEFVGCRCREAERGCSSHGGLDPSAETGADNGERISGGRGCSSTAFCASLEAWGGADNGGKFA